MTGAIKVLVIDDSRSVQKMLELFLSKHRDIEVIGGAFDPYEAVKIMRNVKPDVILLDVKMPGMDGLTFLKKLMEQHPIPVIVHSSLITKNPEIGVRALEYGAVDVIDKPVIDFSNFTSSLNQEDKLLEVIRQAAKTATNKNRIRSYQLTKRQGVRSSFVGQSDFEHIVCVGASAGGTQTIKYLLAHLPQNFPPVVIVQHMPIEFTGQFAHHLNNTSQMHVAEAKDREILVSGKAYIAPGDRHLTIKKIAGKYQVGLEDGAEVSGHKPSVDVLFRSAASVKGIKRIGVILTGMGKDGAEGLLEMKNAECHTIAQDKDSSVVYGMPRKAAEIGAALQICALENLPDHLIKLVAKN